MRGNALSHKEIRNERKDERWRGGGPQRISHVLPTIFMQSSQASAWLHVTLAMAFAHFINEDICQGEDQVYPSAVDGNGNVL